MEPGCSVPHLQEPTAFSFPEPDQSSPCPPSHFLKIHLNIILPFTPGSSKWPLSLRFLHHNPVYNSPVPIRATCSAYLDFFPLYSIHSVELISGRAPCSRGSMALWLALFFDLTRRTVTVLHRRVGTSCRSNVQGSRRLIFSSLTI